MERKKEIVSRGNKTILLLLAAVLLLLSACGSSGTESTDGAGSMQWTSQGKMDLRYAEEFSVEYFEEGTALVTISDGRIYLILDEGAECPEGADPEWIVLQKPLKNLDVVSSAAMEFFSKLDALDQVAFAGLTEEKWALPEVASAMAEGTIRYGGKYSAPDYEMLRASRCPLAIENMMITHSPEIVEQLQNLGIAVLIDCSSNETNPLGRMEWIRLYGLLTDKEEQADALFRAQEEIFQSLAGLPETGKTVAFFSVTAQGEAVIRTGSDYIASMIGTAGGDYLFKDYEPSGKAISSTETIAMESFYKTAKNADILIVNSTLTPGLETLEDLLAKSPVFQNMKAVREGNVYVTNDNVYQSVMELGDFTLEMHRLFSGEDGEMRYFRKLD